MMVPSSLSSVVFTKRDALRPSSVELTSTATFANAAPFAVVLRPLDLLILALGHKPVVLKVQTSHRVPTGKHMVYTRSVSALI
jgi:hypothetical protein